MPIQVTFQQCCRQSSSVGHAIREYLRSLRNYRLGAGQLGFRASLVSVGNVETLALWSARAHRPHSNSTTTYEYIEVSTSSPKVPRLVSGRARSNQFCTQVSWPRPGLEWHEKCWQIRVKAARQSLHAAIVTASHPESLRNQDRLRVGSSPPRTMVVWICRAAAVA